ncbi:MAG TPA: cytochrome c [Xanthobacteraceae bacterium]|nr:cytochrome c [Xanthobacteraceae bacterium]
MAKETCFNSTGNRFSQRRPAPAPAAVDLHQQLSAKFCQPGNRTNGKRGPRLQESFSNTLRRRHTMGTLGRIIRSQSIGAAAIVGLGLIVATSFTALGQNQGSASAKDEIFARKTLMATIARNMYPIDEMRQNGKYDLDKGRANADAISGMLMAFPHLFPPTTNTWSDKAPRDPAVDTFASPTIWEAYDSFYKEAQAASKIAFDLSNAQNDVEFRTKARDLRLACDTCHADYQKNN